MGLADAVALPDEPALPALGGPGPYTGEALRAWRGRGFWMEPGDPRLADLLHGEAAPTDPLDNLVGAGRYWLEHPEHMDFLHPEAPNHRDKLLERELYLSHWIDALQGAHRVLDLGGGVGRFATWLLDQGLEVELVDPDLRSLWRAVTEAADRPGKLDVHWSTGECLPALAPVDVVIAAEVLCYVEDPAAVLAGIARVLRPGGVLLCSVEARWGWAMSQDVHYGTIDAFLGDGIVHVPGDRWVRTFEEADLRALLGDFEIEAIVPTHYALSGPFEAAAGLLEVEEALALEARLAAHPVSRPLNRAWTAICRLS